jgi:hypothetical protein
MLLLRVHAQFVYAELCCKKEGNQNLAEILIEI